MYVTAVILAAGKGLRFGSGAPKLLAKINSKPVIFYCLDTLCKHPLIKDVIVVVSPETQKSIKEEIKKYKLPKIKAVVLGGKLRQDSVHSGLRAINQKAQLVLIHDAARPFIDRDMVSAVIKEARKSGAAIVGIPVKATIKRVRQGFFVEKTLERSNLWEIQTPQVFKKNLILKAYEKYGKIPVTDDAMLVEKLGHKVRVVLGSCANIKITTPADLLIARAILDSTGKYKTFLYHCENRT